MAENKQNGLLWAIGGVLIILGVIYFSVTGGSGSTLKVGVIAPLTGDAASYGEAVRRAYDLAVSEINDAGGVAGLPLELVYEDGECDGPAAITAAQKLVNVDGVKFILGGACSGETLAAAEITQEARVLLLSPTATSPAITQAGDLVFRTYPADDMEARLVAQYAIDRNLTRAAIVSENTDFAQGVRNAFKEAHAGTIVFDEVFNKGETDFRARIANMRAANPQMVYVVPQTTASGERILQEMEENGMNVAVFAGNSMLDRSAIVQNPSLYEEVILSEVQVSTEGKAPAMIAAYAQKYGAEPEFRAFTASAYDSVYLLAEALGSVGQDPEAVAGYFSYKVTDWPGAIGVFNFDENGDAEVELMLVQVVGGQIVPLATE
ncbi:ABC transporter substrate-binding protein [Candidatus Uhrbacteria bacterium]|nr:ABC transporter substrate-binding protein [Candidatus Uhrbacteria bacterium]